MAKRNQGSTTQSLKPTNNILCIACPGTLPRIYHTEAEAAHAAELLKVEFVRCRYLDGWHLVVPSSRCVAA